MAGRRQDRWRSGAWVVLGAVVLAVAAGPPAGAQAAPGLVTVVHAVEGLRADVYLDGADQPALSGFEYRKVTDPLTVPAGTHTAAVFEAGANPKTATPVVDGSFEVRSGADISVVARRDADGKPGLAVFDNAVPPVPSGQAQLWVRHVAVAPPVDVLIDGQPALGGVSNGSVNGTVVPLGQREVTVRATTDGAVLVEPRTLDLNGAAALYLVGSRSDATLGLLAQSPAALGPAAAGPTGVPGGNSGLVAPSDGGPSSPGRWLLVPAVALLGVLALGARRRGRTART